MGSHDCKANQAGGGVNDCGLLIAAFVLAGLAMMLNIRLSYSSAPYALIRFRLPENLFSVFVRRMASALELWCLPSMLLGNIIDLLQKLVIYPLVLQAKAGTSPGEGLRQKAETLYTQANLLDEEVKKAGTDTDTNGNSAKVLHAKSGTLLGLAKALYEKANELASAMGSAGSEGQTQAQQLATAVGPDEDTPNGEPTTLQQKLKALGKQATTDTSQLKSKAEAVKTQYGTVSSRFSDVKGQASTYKSGGKEALYQAVEKAWNDFNNVYKPEELLKDAVGKDDQAPSSDGNPKDLRQALNQLSTSSILNMHNNAEEVKKKFDEGWGNDVKGKFELVKEQVSAYNAGTIETSNYTPVVDAFKEFNKLYREAICSPKFYSIIIPSIVCQWLNFLTYVILLIVYVMGGDTGHLTVFYFVIAISGVVFGINMTLVYSVDWNYIPIYIAGENSFPIVTSFIHYLTTLMFGNRRKWNSDFIIVNIDIWVAILISFTAAVVWTFAYAYPDAGKTDKWHHIFAFGFGTGEFKPEVISPFLMIVVGMGLVYAIYPGIAPGMIVPFYLIDKIEMVLLVATIFPPVIVAVLRRTTSGWPPPAQSPMCQWSSTEKGNGTFWHCFDLLMVIKISLAIIFIYSLHYRDSSISRSIINQPKMSTFLSITFYMCHECLLALGFPGLVGANGGGDYVLIPQYIGALFMIFLAFYSEGYIIEYKSHDPGHWPTDGMLYLYGYYQLNPDFLL